MTSRPSCTSRLNADRSPWASPSRARSTSACTSWLHSAASSAGPGLVSASRGAAVPSADPMNSSSSSVPRICTGYGTGTPAAYSRASALNSAPAHCPAIASRPNALRLATARLVRDSRVRRPSR
jgi:hypothetical protein